MTDTAGTTPGSTARFPFFNESKAPAGGEGWESMYPYYLVPS